MNQLSTFADINNIIRVETTVKPEYKKQLELVENNLKEYEAYLSGRVSNKSEFLNDIGRHYMIENLIKIKAIACITTVVIKK